MPFWRVQAPAGFLLKYFGPRVLGLKLVLAWCATLHFGASEGGLSCLKGHVPKLATHAWNPQGKD